MNSNRKRNLKKLARNIITATALTSSLNPTGTNAAEDTNKSTGTVVPYLTTAAIVGGFGLLTGVNYYSREKSERLKKEYNDRQYQLQLKQATLNLERAEIKKLMTRYQINAARLQAIVGAINEIRARNGSQNLITSDHILGALKNGGEFTKKFILGLLQLDPAQDSISDYINKTLATRLTEKDDNLQLIYNAVDILINNNRSAREIRNTVNLVVPDVVAHRELNNWNNFARVNINNIDRTHNMGINGAQTRLRCYSNDQTTLRNSNFLAADALIPKSLQPVIGDMIWCGIGVSEPSAANAGRVWLPLNPGNKNGFFQTIGQYEIAEKTMSKGNVPMYLILSTDPENRDNFHAILDDDYRVIPLFTGLIGKRGGSNARDIKSELGNWLLSAAYKAADSDRIATDGVADYS